MVNATHAASSDFHTDLPVVVSDAGLVHATSGAFLGDRAGMEMFGWTFAELCAACHARSAGHGHFALYCEPCSELPYGVAAAPVRPLLEVLQEHVAGVQASRQQPAAGRCAEHPAYDAGYCPLCGTARVIGAGR